MTALTSTSIREFAASTPAADARPVGRKWLVFWALFVTAFYALLWSPYWYPLSDSSLYLSMGRSVATGRGLTIMGDPVRLVPPLTPLFIGLLMKLKAGIGTIQAVMIVLMLISHGLSFLTLRRWMNERLALAATLASALSYWVFANAFTIMSEPLCVALMWGGFLALSYVRVESPRRWTMLVVACLLLLLSAANRDAVLCLLPGPLLAVMIQGRRNGRWSRESWVWAAVFAVVFGSWFLYRYPPDFLIGMLTPRARVTSSTTQSTTAPSAAVTPPPTAINPEDEGEPGEKLREGRYKPGWLNGVKRDWKHMITEPPVFGGRWVSEGLVMATVVVFESKLEACKIIGTTVALTAFVLAIVGGLYIFLDGQFRLLSLRSGRLTLRERWHILLERGRWWVLGPALYFTFIWVQWGDRIKPRYMIPIAPILFLFVWRGMTWLVVLLAAQPKESKWNTRVVGRVLLYVLVGMVFLGNIFPWSVEFYIRHVSKRDFYDLARRSAYAQLVDIGAYAQQHVPPGQSLWTNAGAHRRIAYFLSGHKIETTELAVGTWKEWELLMQQTHVDRPGARPTTDPATTRPTGHHRKLTYAQRRRRFFAGIARSAKYLIVYVNHPKKGESWPGWHLPMHRDDNKTEWWRLYERQPDETWKKIKVPHNRDYVRSIPRADD
jgi:hypothetical protein